MECLRLGKIRGICWVGRGFAVFATAVLSVAVAAVAEEPPTSNYRWFSVSIDVAGLPPRAEWMPTSCPLDLTGLLNSLQIAGEVDERSLRLLEIREGQEIETAVQFLAAPRSQPRERRLLADTPDTVSYRAEYPAGVSPAGEAPAARSTGELFWMTRSIGTGAAHFRLQFGVLEQGRMIQVPYPPQNLRAFDARGMATPMRRFPAMQIRPQRPLDGVVQMLADQLPVLGYHVGPSLRSPLPSGGIRRPFLYPVVGPEGVSLTEFGKPHDPTESHAHHYSLWVGHADVGGANFWSETGHAIHHDQLTLLEDGPVFCRLVQKNRWLRQDEPVLLERRQTTLYRTPDAFRLFDLDLEFTAPGQTPTQLGKTSFGFLAARVAQSMSVFDGGGEIVNSEGDRNEAGAHLKRAKWLDQSGPISEGKWNGLAMFDHPSNLHHPTFWHCRNDGWAGASFNKDEAFTVKPGQPLRLRYRCYLHRGNSESGQVAGCYEMYAAQPTILVGKPAAR